MEISKLKAFCCSLWLIPVILGCALALLSCVMVQYRGYDGILSLDEDNLAFCFWGLGISLVGYLIAACITKNKKDWRIFYISVGMLALLVAIFNILGLYANTAIMVIYSYFVGLCTIFDIIFAFVIRKEVLYRDVYAHSDEYKAEEKRKEKEKYNRAISSYDLNKSTIDRRQPTQSLFENAIRETSENSDIIQMDTKTENVDVNTCAEEQLMNLPGITLADAHRAIKERNENGDYNSVEDFVQRNQIKPHIAIKFMEFLDVSQQVDSSVSVKKSRSLDL